jgi:hypothetical protein
MTELGMELCIHIVFGPYAPSDDSVETAKRAYLQWVRDRHDRVVCQRCGSLQPRDSTIEQNDQECSFCDTSGELVAVSNLERWVDSGGDDTPMCFKIVDDIVTDWIAALDGAFPDFDYRFESDESTVVACAGEMTYVDEAPTGQGYNLLQRILALPRTVQDALGFR